MGVSIPRYGWFHLLYVNGNKSMTPQIFEDSIFFNGIIEASNYLEQGCKRYIHILSFPYVNIISTYLYKLVLIGMSYHIFTISPTFIG